MIDENYFFRGKEENYCYRADGSIKESENIQKNVIYRNLTEFEEL